MTTPQTPTPPAARRGLDAEIQTLAKIDRLLADLPDEARKRTLLWVLAKFSGENGVHVTVSSNKDAPGAPASGGGT